jgi:hypothetical protein
VSIASEKNSYAKIGIRIVASIPFWEVCALLTLSANSDSLLICYGTYASIV